ADREGAVEQADVDAELERVGRGDAEQLALHESALDVAPLLRRVAGAVGRKPLRGLRVDAIRRHAVDELRLLAALREADRAQAALHELGHDPRGVAEGACADAELGVDQLRVPERDRSFRAWCRIVADRSHRYA